MKCRSDLGASRIVPSTCGFEPRPGRQTGPGRCEGKESIVLQTPKQITRALDRVLHKVSQPARYTGGELNSIIKDWSDPRTRTKIALAFPEDRKSTRLNSS